MRHFFSRLKRNEKGQGLVEFGLVVLPLLIIILGIIEFGWLFNAQITVTSAAREGARVGAVLNNEIAIKDAVISHVSSSGLYQLDYSDIDVDFPEGLKEVRVFVEGNVRPLVGFFVRDNVVLNGSAIMRLEYLVGDD